MHAMGYYSTLKRNRGTDKCYEVDKSRTTMPNERSQGTSMVVLMANTSLSNAEGMSLILVGKLDHTCLSVKKIKM